tara:strand:+ start:557 stop:769 length:213 start_codon:yes stop_codon:yes gene_type:complete
MSKKLKDGVYKTSDTKNRITYFVHDGLVGMQWKYGTFKTTTNFMLGAKWEEPLPMSAGEFMKAYNKLEQW